MKIMEEYGIAFAEVSEILKIFPEEELNKIPQSFINTIEKCKDKNYRYELVDGVDLYEQQMTEETKTILSVIYRDYICTKEEKAELIKEDIKTNVLEEKEKVDKYNAERMLKNNKIDDVIDDEIQNEEISNDELEQEELVNTETQLVELKWYEKVLVKIKGWFFYLFK